MNGFLDLEIMLEKNHKKIYSYNIFICNFHKDFTIVTSLSLIKLYVWSSFPEKQM